MARQASRAASLDEGVVRRLRQLDREGRVNVREASTMYGVSTETIRRVLRRDTWQHVKDAPPPAREDEMQARIAASQAGLLARLAADGVAVTLDQPPEADPLGDAAKAREAAGTERVSELMQLFGAKEKRYD